MYTIASCYGCHETKTILISQAKVVIAEWEVRQTVRWRSGLCMYVRYLRNAAVYGPMCNDI